MRWEGCGNARRARMNEFAFRRAIRVGGIARVGPPTIRMRKTPEPRWRGVNLSSGCVRDRLRALRTRYPARSLVHAHTPGVASDTSSPRAGAPVVGKDKEPRTPRSGGARLSQPPLTPFFSSPSTPAYRIAEHGRGAREQVPRGGPMHMIEERAGHLIRKARSRSPRHPGLRFPPRHRGSGVFRILTVGGPESGGSTHPNHPAKSDSIMCMGPPRSSPHPPPQSKAMRNASQATPCRPGDPLLTP